MSKRFGDADRLERIRSRRELVGIIGLGYVGLPLARAFSSAGFRVLGFDTDAEKIGRLGRGESYIGHFSNEAICAMRAAGFEATSDFGRLGEPDTVIICVPTPLTESRTPDLSFVEASTEAIGESLRAGQLIVLESTTYPGTTRAIVRPILERGGLRAGVDFGLAYSPEREDPGNPNYAAPSIPRWWFLLCVWRVWRLRRRRRFWRTHIGR
jgi:UDP-N-acetyl-D-glucosamine dehydrogenase